MREGFHTRVDVKHTRVTGQKLSKIMKSLANSILGKFRLHRFCLSLDLVHNIQGSPAGIQGRENDKQNGAKKVYENWNRS